MLTAADVALGGGAMHHLTRKLRSMPPWLPGATPRVGCRAAREWRRRSCSWTGLGCRL